MIVPKLSINQSIYLVTVEVAENDYFIVATNQTIFTVEKLASKITASPVSITYNIGKVFVNLLVGNFVVGFF